MPFTTAFTALKRRLFPLNYEPCEWIEGKEVMLEFLFGCWPPTSIDATTGGKLHQREDYNHLLKGIVSCVREGKIPAFNVVSLRDALHDPGNDSLKSSKIYLQFIKFQQSRS